MKVHSITGKIVHYRMVAHHRVLRDKWRRVLLPEFKTIFYREDRPPSSQLYLSAKHLPNADLTYKVLDAARSRHREVTVKLSPGKSLLYLMFYKDYVRRRYKNVWVQLQKSDEGGILVSWDGLAKEWKRGDKLCTSPTPSKEALSFMSQMMGKA